jgi:two-component sensor histidine kinase
VSGMLQMQARPQSPELAAALTKAIDRVQVISTIHTSLYKGGRKDDLEFSDYLKNLCDRLAASLTDGERINIAVEAEPADIPVDDAVPLGIIVNELVTNAVKHAFPPPSSGVISVRFVARDEDIFLSIGDSGRGLPNMDTPGQPGLGMKLVDAMVRQLGAKMEVTHHPGTTYDIRLRRAMKGRDGVS